LVAGIWRRSVFFVSRIICSNAPSRNRAPGELEPIRRQQLRLNGRDYGSGPGLINSGPRWTRKVICSYPPFRRYLRFLQAFRAKRGLELEIGFPQGTITAKGLRACNFRRARWVFSPPRFRGGDQSSAERQGDPGNRWAGLACWFEKALKGTIFAACFQGQQRATAGAIHLHKVVARIHTGVMAWHARWTVVEVDPDVGGLARWIPKSPVGHPK